MCDIAMLSKKIIRMNQVERMNKTMQEYSRIVIENYCLSHRKTKKSKFLWNFLELSYDMECEPEDWEMVELEKLIFREKNMELKEALEDLDEFFCG